MKGLKDLEIYKISFQLSVDIYFLSLKLPNSEKYETANQIRRSSQSIKDNIAEGYGRRNYKNDFIKFLVYSRASLLESKSQSEFLDATHPDTGWKEISIRLKDLEFRFKPI
jgi:four helix bundle protein